MSKFDKEFRGEDLLSLFTCSLLTAEEELEYRLTVEVKSIANAHDEYLKRFYTETNILKMMEEK